MTIIQNLFLAAALVSLSIPKADCQNMEKKNEGKMTVEFQNPQNAN